MNRLVGAVVQFVAVVLTVQSTMPAISASQGTLLTDAQALLAIKAGLGNPVQLATWLNVSEVCRWRNVKCDPDINRVTQLTLQNENRDPLSGTLAPDIGNLTELTFLDLSFNEISGSIPPEIGRLVKLNKMYLGRNSFTGDIPPELGNLVVVEELTVDHCNLDGVVPPELGNLTNAQKLDISNNNFSTTLPKELGNLQSALQLFLGSGVFIGEIPSELGNLPFIRHLSLDNNNFTGSVPLSFINLTDTLTELSVSSNRLSGYLPPELSQVQSFTYQDQAGNNSFCSQKNAYPGIPQCPPGTPGVPLDPGVHRAKKGPRVGAIVGAVVGGIILLGAVFGLLFFCLFPWAKSRRGLSHKSLRKHEGRNGRVKWYPIETLRTATKDWTEVIGRGGFGPVYKGILPNGQVVAIKRLRMESAQGRTEFQNEIDLLSRLHHRCLVNLVGWCDDNNESILVYEYKTLGSLDKHLRPSDPTDPVLPWSTRINIAVDVAEGLDYLHYGAEPPVIHRDIKSSNVLLDAAYNGSLADFGLGRLNHADDTHISTNVKGTPGYMDPEYVMLQQLTFASDVYSYGVLLLEIISGMKAFDTLRGSSSGKSLADNKSLSDNKPLDTASGRDAQTASSSGQWSGSTQRSAAGLDISAVLDVVDSSFHPLLSQYAKSFLLDESLTEDLVDPRLEGAYDKEQLIAIARVAISCLQSSHRDRPTMRDVYRMLPLRSTPWQRASDTGEGEARNRALQSGGSGQSDTNASSGFYSVRVQIPDAESRPMLSRTWSNWSRSSLSPGQSASDVTGR